MNDLTQPHAEFDRFPALAASLAQQFGSEGLDGVITRILQAEHAEFCWDGRLAEMPLGAYQDGIEETETGRGIVRVLGYFQARYYVATLVIDADRRVEFLLRYRLAETFAAALANFFAGP